ncbi:MAG: hypothetical protein ACXQTI_02305 [Candidatus Nezhaarchaeales archaeon]
MRRLICGNNPFILMRQVRWYRQDLGDPTIIEGEHLDLNSAINMLRELEVTVGEPPNGIPWLLGFEGDDGAFIEFVKTGLEDYDVRYENPRVEESLMGSLKYDEAVDCLEDFYEGKELRWKFKLETY